jgi:hypothetical protein
MLAQAELTLALKAGQAHADRCHPKFCAVGATVDGQVYQIHHNGLGPSDTSAATVHATAILGLNQEKMGEHLGKWIAALHKREHIDPNLVRT